MVQCELKILTETSPKVFRVLGDCRAANIILDKLETSLAGTMLLAEYDGRYSRLLAWFWKYGLSRDVFNTIHLGGDWPERPGVGRGYILAGCSPGLPISESVLKEKWSGRLLIQAYEKRPFMLFECLWHDIRRSLRDSLSCGGSRRS